MTELKQPCGYYFQYKIVRSMVPKYDKQDTDVFLVNLLILLEKHILLDSTKSKMRDFVLVENTLHSMQNTQA